MPPLLALTIWFILLVALFYFDPARDRKESWALWVPLLWMFFVGSRDPSQWIGGGVGAAQAYELETGNGLDRTFFSILIVVALGILVSRSFRWGNFFFSNFTLMLFLAFCLSSTMWSDYPFITVKHWIRDLTNYLVVLIILSDPRPLDAVRTVLRRLGYLLIPLSIVLIKYFPQLARQYAEWSGQVSFVGVSTTKNMLGASCLVTLIFFFWDTTTRWPQRKQRQTRLILLINVVFIAMTLWVMHMAQSTTSTVCLGLAGVVLVAGQLKIFRWRPGLFKALAPAAFGLYLVLTFALDMRGVLANAVGKDSTLTDRTKIWEFLLGMHTNPAIGVGYQTFWIGPRLLNFWENAGFGHLNEAHNGYLEVYLELGMIGVFLLGLFLISSYRNVCRKLATDRSLSILGMATWMVMIFYNMSEAAFEGGLLFMMLLIGTLAVPRRILKRAPITNTFSQAVAPPSPAMQLGPTQSVHWTRR